MYGQRYQISLIFLGIIIAIMLGVFFYRELFPEYGIYQNDYIALEAFRTTYSGEPPPDFKKGVKQIVFEREDKGPATIDRCISCHVAEELPHFSPTKIAYDINGNIVREVDGTPAKVPNENYIWIKLDQKIAELTDAEANARLERSGERYAVKKRLEEAQKLVALKTAQVGEHTYDVTKVLRMHPLIGKETRPFELHPLEEYGCISCHSGNGKGLTTEKAHGPVFDGEYEAEYMGPTPQFLERDSKNDPQFASVFNFKPGDTLLFQTSPILVGALIQSSCVQCHKNSAAALQGLTEKANHLAQSKTKSINLIEQSFQIETDALISLMALKKLLKEKGYALAIKEINNQLVEPALNEKDQKALSNQLAFLEKEKTETAALQKIDQTIHLMLGSKPIVEEFESQYLTEPDQQKYVKSFLKQSKGKQGAEGTLFVKWEAANLQQSLLNHIQDTEQSFNQATEDQQSINSISSDIDLLTKNYQQGEHLYLAQACYACHKISGMARGGVGPELTYAGTNYPWYLKRKMVWPQGDLPTSTMPKLHLDHVELEDLMTFLLAQKGPTKTVSQTDYKIAVQEWEAGRKMGWEKPITPSQMHDLRYSMTVFATEGCAACHRLNGFESNVGFSVEKQANPSFNAVYNEHNWFKTLFPEEIEGSEIVKTIDEKAAEIDQHISDNVRQNSILEEIKKNYPGLIEGFYANFRYALRAKNSLYEKKSAQLEEWKNRVHRVLMIYIQEYGLGHLIGPKPDWSGIYRSDEWLMEHFHNPSSHVPKSIMPIMPFDESKFYALTYMLDVLGKRNRDAVHTIWENKGFDPEEAFNIHCQQCHGEFLQGNGPIANWIYPIPKNLRSAEFLRNLTKEVAIQSITHGVKGTPMAPWGEAAKDKQNYDGKPVLTAEEIERIVDWLYAGIPGARVIRGIQDVPKWQYSPKDVIEELYREGNNLKEAESKEEDRNTLTSISLKTLGADYFYASAAGLQVTNDNVATVFDIKPNPDKAFGDEKYAYFIKQKYYTPENLQAGKRFFDLNCAVCHGADADGSGIRASVMFDAKPRMLTNLDWLNSRDDLRLLRSIKYGVPGTAMTPWGDLTSSLQRLQLVMYIRSLSTERELRDAFATAIFQAFDQSEMAIEKAREPEYSEFEKTQKEYETFKLQVKDHKSIENAVELYKKQLELGEKMAGQQAKDKLYLQLKHIVEKEREFYLSLGNAFIAAGLNSGMWEKLLKTIELHAQQFTYSNGQLEFTMNVEKERQIEALAKEIGEALDLEQVELENEKRALEGQFSSQEKNERLQLLEAKSTTYRKIKSKLFSGLKSNLTLNGEMSEIMKRI